MTVVAGTVTVVAGTAGTAAAEPAGLEPRVCVVAKTVRQCVGTRVLTQKKKCRPMGERSH